MAGVSWLALPALQPSTLLDRHKLTSFLLLFVCCFCWVWHKSGSVRRLLCTNRLHLFVFSVLLWCESAEHVELARVYVIASCVSEGEWGPVLPCAGRWAWKL